MMANYLLENQESERLFFRKLLPSDMPAWLPFHQHPLSNQYWTPANPDPEIECKETFMRIFHRYSNNLGGMNALISKEQGCLVGKCGLLVQEVDGQSEMEIGYSILPEYWRQGYASEAAQKCRTFAFANNLAESLISIIHINNIPSINVARNNGMQRDKSTTYKGNPVHIFRVFP